MGFLYIFSYALLSLCCLSFILSLSRWLVYSVSFMFIHSVNDIVKLFLLKLNLFFSVRMSRSDSRSFLFYQFGEKQNKIQTVFVPESKCLISKVSK